MQRWIVRLKSISREMQFRKQSLTGVKVRLEIRLGLVFSGEVTVGIAESAIPKY